MFQRGPRHDLGPPSSRTRRDSRRDRTGREASEEVPITGTRLPSRLDRSHHQASEATSRNGTRLNSRLDPPRRGDAMGGAGSSSTFKSQNDIQMASRQTQYDLLSPQDRTKQETWAQTQLLQNLGRCPVGLKWIRKEGGYECMAAIHFVTDELVAEGKGRYYELSMVRGGGWAGPYPKRGRDGRMQRGQEGLFGLRRIGR